MRPALLAFAGMVAIGAPLVTANAQSLSGATQAQNTPYASDIAEAARRFGIPPAWITAVIHVESDDDLNAVSSAGAMGLMQIMPTTWADLRTRYKLGENPINPHDNILAGVAFLREMLDRFGTPGFLAAYNAGPARYAEYLVDGRPLPAETRIYATRLLPLIGRDCPAMIALTMPSPAYAWTKAPLFVVLSSNIGATGLMAPELRPRGAWPDVEVHALSAIKPRSTGLFAIRMAADSAP